LELHCRDKEERVQPDQGSGTVVASQQHETYQQFINKVGGPISEQLVGELWTIGGRWTGISHREEVHTAYATPTRYEAAILPKIVIKEEKC
jgi:hypothetical protein